MSIKDKIIDKMRREDCKPRDDELRIGNDKVVTSSFSRRVIIIALAAITVLYIKFFLGVLDKMIGVLLPFLIGLAVAYIWNLLLTPIERHWFPNSENARIKGLKRPACMLLSFLILIGFLCLLLYLIIPQIHKSVHIMTKAAPEFIKSAQDRVLELTANWDWAKDIRKSIENYNMNWNKVFEKIVGFSKGGLTDIVQPMIGVISNLMGVFITAFTVIVFAIYVLFSKEKLAHQISNLATAYISQKKRSKIKYFLDIANQTFSSFVRGQVLDAFAVGMLLLIAMLLFGIREAATVSVLVMVTALVPMIGAFIGGGIGFIIVCMDGFYKGLLFLILLMVVQQLEGNLIYPRIVGKSIGMPGIWVFVAVMIGGALTGPFGMLLAVPIAATFYKILREDVNKKILVKKEEL